MPREACSLHVFCEQQSGHRDLQMGRWRERGLGLGLGSGKLNQLLIEMQNTAAGRDADKADPALNARQIKSGMPIRHSMGIINLQLAQ